MYRIIGLTWMMLALVAGCGGSSPTETEAPAIAGALKKASGPAELEASIKAGFTAVRGSENLALTGGSPDGTFTGTYTQEQDVDEFDAVRYDGSRLFVAPRRYLSCCYLVARASDDGATDGGSPAEASIRILSTDPASGSATLESSIPLEEEVSVQGMYLDEERMLALTSTLVYGGYGNYWTDIAIWAPERLGYRVYDVSDPASPSLEVDVGIDGVFVDSRRVGDVVYIVSRYTPTIEGLVHNVQSAAEQAQNQALLANVPLDALLPKMTVDGQSRTLVDPDNCYIGTDDDVGFPVITSVTAVPINDPAAASTTCYNEDAYGVYVSAESIYFTELLGGEMPGDATTRIHKFSLAGTALTYRGSAEVDGQVWRGGQADFRMNEHDGYLRVLASSYAFGTSDFVDHKLYVLRESPSLPELDVVAELPNAQHPEEIGKPNEALYGVRFLGERAYAVTFEQIDPLYVIDLSDPQNPQIAGELTVRGFSDFLHPVTDELLLGLGTPDGGGVKLELFDVSVITRPLSRGSVTLGEQGTYSEANHDRHAFTYQSGANGIDRLAIPATLYGESAGGLGLHLFEIHDKTLPSMASLLSVGAVTPPSNDGTFPFNDRNRAFIHDDTIYYVRGEEVWAAFWSAPTMVNGPF
jgi:uncharacterized secreted protein with C-terminal beta-propeller domain